MNKCLFIFSLLLMCCMIECEILAKADVESKELKNETMEPKAKGNLLQSSMFRMMFKMLTLPVKMMFYPELNKGEMKTGGSPMLMGFLGGYKARDLWSKYNNKKVINLQKLKNEIEIANDKQNGIKSRLNDATNSLSATVRRIDYMGDSLQNEVDRQLKKFIL